MMLKSFKNRIIRLIRRNGASLFPVGRLIKISPDFVVGKYVNINIPNTDIDVLIEDNVIFKEFCSILIFSKGRLKIEKNVFFNNYCSINCLFEIKIGQNTIIGEGVKIYDHNHSYDIIPVLKIYPDKFSLGSVFIGENCWIGSNVTILKGVTIGDNVIIGANNLIHKSIPSNTIIKSGASIIIDYI
ncbi:acyltransferase [Mucilaginibacter lappiensis]|uniref:Acetyltransferase-like isoleucine patch superfamily enzyme n=1 Tax=Mucilaginibacter lappiensis TaxID=354630 RepID=A0A841J775_9SPHI|nr:acyltransferase [Mucilaginibacter lappiensis]MBB6127039.1 acetyltransferase-like isoleucine patch superfamily enzyme [Mucilaginibacter lappiensis]